MGRRTTLLTLDAIDQRPVAWRKICSIRRSLQRQLRFKPTALERAAIDRAACLMALAEDAMTRLLRGDPGISHDQVVRTENVARRGMKDLRTILRRRPNKADLGTTPELDELFGVASASAEIAPNGINDGDGDGA